VLGVAAAVILLLAVGLWNATLQPSEKGFYAMSFVLSLFAVSRAHLEKRPPIPILFPS
jgi:uncharacterized membrane protein YiaA